MFAICKCYSLISCLHVNELLYERKGDFGIGLFDYEYMLLVINSNDNAYIGIKISMSTS